MTITYCTDEQIAEEDPRAADYLPSGDTDFDRIRVLVYERINRQLSRRNPAVIAPTDLSDVTQLVRCEVYGVLAELLFKGASRAGTDGQDWHTQEALRYDAMYRAELDAPLSVDGEDQAVVGSIRLRRC